MNARLRSPLERDDRITVMENLIVQLARSLQWRLEPEASAQACLEAVIGEYRLEVDLGGVTLRAWLDSDLAPQVRVRISAGWSEPLAHDLRGALERLRSPLARLLLLEWRRVDDGCRYAPRGE